MSQDDCIHCGQNSGEVCRGCHERARREACAQADERLDLQYVQIARQQSLTAHVAERLVLAEDERDKLRAQLARLREAARALTDGCAVIRPVAHLNDNDICYPRVGLIRALAKALEE